MMFIRMLIVFFAGYFACATVSNFSGTLGKVFPGTVPSALVFVLSFLIGYGLKLILTGKEVKPPAERMELFYSLIVLGVSLIIFLLVMVAVS